MKMKKFLLAVLFCLLSINLFSQILIGEDKYFIEGDKFSNQESAIYYLNIKAGNFAYINNFNYFKLENLKVVSEYRIDYSSGYKYEGTGQFAKAFSFEIPSSMSNHVEYFATGIIILSKDKLEGFFDSYTYNCKYLEEKQAEQNIEQERQERKIVVLTTFFVASFVAIIIGTFAINKINHN